MFTPNINTDGRNANKKYIIYLYVIYNLKSVFSLFIPHINTDGNNDNMKQETSPLSYNVDIRTGLQFICL